MAAIFKVPLEVRDLIYEELLVYRGGAIKLQEYVTPDVLKLFGTLKGSGEHCSFVVEIL